MDLFLKTAPNDELVVPIADLRQYLNLAPGDTSSDALIDDFRAGARIEIETETNCAIGEQTWIYYRDSFPDRADQDGQSKSGEIELPLPPLITVSSIKYLDASGVLQTHDAGKWRFVRGGKERGRIQPVYGQAWPTTYPHAQAVQVEFKCGYKVAADTSAGEQELPAPLLRAIKIVVEDSFNNRAGNEDSTRTIKRLCSPWMSERFGHR